MSSDIIYKDKPTIGITKFDLFKVDPSYAFAHCVGNDFSMGAGIALEFNKRYGHKDWLIDNSKGVGTALLLSIKDTDRGNDETKYNVINNDPNKQISPIWIYTRNIFYLVSKPYSRTSKPTYDNLKACLIDMFNQMKKHKLTKVAMPKIGCGLDGLEWCKVITIIEEVRPKDIHVLVCTL